MTDTDDTAGAGITYGCVYLRHARHLPLHARPTVLRVPRTYLLLLRLRQVIGGDYRCVGVEDECLGEIQGQRATLVDCDLHGGKGRGLHVQGEKTFVRAERCRLRNNFAPGASINYWGQAELVDCTMTGNENGSVLCLNGAEAVVRNCEMDAQPRGEKGGKVTVQDASGAVVEVIGVDEMDPVAVYMEMTGSVFLS